MTDRREGLTFYRGGLRHDRRRRSAVRLDVAGNSLYAHGECCSRELSTRFFCELPAFGSALPTCRAGACSHFSVSNTDNVKLHSLRVGRGLAPAVLHRHAVVYRRLWTVALFAQLILFVACGLLPRLRALPSNSRKPAGARLDRALFLAHSFVFLLHFVGRLSLRFLFCRNSPLSPLPIIMNYEL